MVTDPEANEALARALDAIDSVDQVLAEGADERQARAERIRIDRMTRWQQPAAEPPQRPANRSADYTHRAELAQRAAADAAARNSAAWTAWARKIVDERILGTLDGVGQALAITRGEIEADAEKRVAALRGELSRTIADAIAVAASYHRQEVDSLRSEIAEMRGQIETMRREASPPAKLRRIK